MKPLVLGAFEINGVNLTSQGLWAHPDQNTWRYTDLDYWLGLARLLDRGGFDFLFLADSYGYPSMDGKTPDVAFEQAVEIPKNDPMLLVPALAAATRTLAFGVTTSTSFEAPFANARRFATLDHLTRGRVAWNVVTTSNAIVGDLFGRTRFVPHDERYAIAQEYLEVSYALLEGSWEDDAVLADKATRRYADPTKVHEVHHHGTYFDVHGYFNSEPSLQRTPVLFQAGSSSSGRAFAARNAELVFLQGKDAGSLAAQVADLRSGAVAAGRRPDDIKAIVGLSVLTAATTAEAERKLEELLSYVDADAARVYYASMTGVDLASLDPDASFDTVETEGGRTQVERYRDRSVREATADFLRHGMREFILVGTPIEVVDRMAELVEATGIDGFNVTPFLSPGSYEEFVDEIVPELRRRGLMSPAAVDTNGDVNQHGNQHGNQHEHRHGNETPAPTFRERLFGDGARLPDRHPAAAFRRRPSSRPH